jgi:hypothetical protein
MTLSSGSDGTFDNLLGDRLLRTSEMPLLTDACLLLGEGNLIMPVAWSCAWRHGRLPPCAGHGPWRPALASTI